jgi:hypothetical protein
MLGRQWFLALQSSSVALCSTTFTALAVVLLFPFSWNYAVIEDHNS